MRNKVVNDVGGSVYSDGDWLRVGGSLTWWVAPSFGLVGACEFTAIALDKSEIVLQGGVATVAGSTPGLTMALMSATSSSSAGIR